MKVSFCNLQWKTEMEGGRLINPKQPWMWYDSDQVIPESYTSVFLFAENRPARIHYWDDTWYEPSAACGLLRSVDRFGYGRFSAEIKLPRGKSLWPAFWLVGEDEPWPKCGEIDIMEGWTNQFGGYFQMGIPQPPYLVPSWNTTINIHWNDDYQEYWNYDGHKSCGSRRLPIIFSLKRPTHNFIKYECEWRPNSIAFFANGHCVRTYGWDVSQHLLNKKMRVIFDLWTTGKNFVCETPMKIRNFEYKPLEIL